MSEQPCSVQGIIATAVLSSHKVLSVLKLSSFQHPLREQELREATYLTYQPWAARYPDHVFQSGWQRLVGSDEGGQERDAMTWSNIALRALAREFLEPKYGTLTVKLNKFGAWQQSVLSRICGLPVQAAATLLARDHAYLANDNYPTSDGDWHIGFPGTHRQRVHPLLSPHDDIVEDYIGREGLHETHLHLNGSTHAEVCWLRALLNPTAETRNFDSKWKRTSNPDSSKIRELAHAINPELSPVELYRQLRVAGQLRQWLIAAVTERLGPDTELPENYESMASGEAPTAPEPGDWTLKLLPHSSDAEKLVAEERWISALLLRLEKQPSVRLDRMLHCYLVLQNQYYRLLVQSEEQFGFDQFQKLTYTDLRESAEENYLQRFRSMHGEQPNHSRIGYLEGRFAPKQSLRGNYSLLKSILGGYWRYLGHDPLGIHQESRVLPPLSVLLHQLDEHFKAGASPDSKHHRLALVAHFIKQPWNTEPAYKAGPYRFYRLRNELEDRANTLLQTLHRWPRLRCWLRGIDAAANELHAPPEVFASCYRVCQRAGLTRRSYHAGEDFPHLLSGLRHMLDALELLDLRDGDRIGHGTAMGISPRLWIERMPGQLIVKKGEWMLDLLATWRLLRRMPEATADAYRVECELSELASYVFDKDVSCTALERAMQFRHLNLRYLMAAQEESWQWENASHSDFWRAEARLVHGAKRTNQRDLELLWIWFSDRELWNRSEALMEVDTAYFDARTFIKTQQALMAEVNKRRVVIETLPSSNVRISQYYNFHEHHSLRWMRVPGFVEDGDPEIMVSLGSDDPGIFAGDLNGEFYQLYAALRSKGFGDKAALDYLSPVNERGRQYRFHARSIG
ncbi:MAG: hypothetical protein Q7U78_00845 [Gallionella sp.]|nr:hypothetical protein [Gallionella sp.]